MKLALLLSALIFISSTGNLGASEMLTWDDPPLQPIGPPTPRPPDDFPVPPTPIPDPEPAPLPVPEPVPGPSNYTYAAIAYSYSTGRFGRSTNQPDGHAAIRAAQVQCGQDCQFTHWVNNGCMGIARSYNDGVSFAYAPDSRGAGASAYESCQRSFGNCALITSVCSAGYH